MTFVRDTGEAVKGMPYENVPPHRLILRDRLAVDRTLLANERTLLAYLRTALALVIVGITCLHFFQIGVLLYLGLVSIPFGLIVAVLGIIRYRRMDRSIRSAREPAKAAPALVDESCDAERTAR